MDTKRVKDCINYFKDRSNEEVINSLKGSNKLNNDEKNLIYLYLFPRQLLDRELPGRILKNRGTNLNGFLEPNISEAGLIIEAYRTRQYGRYIKHLFHSFVEGNEQIFPVAGEEFHECGLCTKKIAEHDTWEKTCKGTIEESRKEFLAYGSSGTEITLCLDCLIQLKVAYDLLCEIEGPEFLDWRKKYEFNQQNGGWQDFKL